MISEPTIIYDHSGSKHLDHNIKISLLLCSYRPERLERTLANLISLSCKPDNIEVLVKIDDETKHLNKFRQILSQLPCEHKLLISPQLDKYWSLYIFLNELSKLARGEIFWYICDEMKPKTQNWDKILCNTRNIYTDNIYLFNPRGTIAHPKFTGLPAISKEWFDTLGFLSPFPEVDVFLVKLALFLHRFYVKDTIAFRLDKESWMLHNRLELKIGRNWTAVKKAMHQYIENIAAPLFRKRMTDPRETPNPQHRGCEVRYNWR